MLDCPARMKTLIGLAKELGERTHSRAALRIAVGFIVIFLLVLRFLRNAA
jgi:FtsH-binding integral membrane protein